MVAIVVRNLDPEVQRRLKRQAAAHDRSMEAEVRAILSSAVSAGDFVTAWLEMAAKLPGADLALPVRSAPREVDLS